MVILLVEDDVALGEITAELLAGVGHAVAWATTVDEAVMQLPPAHRVDAMLLDLQLGRERGETVVQRMRANRQKIPPFVLFSAQPIDELRSVAASLGAAGIIQKPCSIAKLTQVLDDSLRGQGPA